MRIDMYLDILPLIHTKGSRRCARGNNPEKCASSWCKKPFSLVGSKVLALVRSGDARGEGRFQVAKATVKLLRCEVLQRTLQC